MKKVLLYILLTVSFALQAQDKWPEPFIVSPDTIHYRSFKTSQFQYVTTGQDSIPFSKITTAQYTKRFKKLSDNYDNDFDDKEHAWVRFRLKNPHSYPFPITLPVDVKKSTVYICANNKWQQFTSGYSVSWEKRDGIKQTRQIVYTMPANTSVYVYMYLSELTYSDVLFPNVNNYFTEVKEKFHDQINYVMSDVVMGCFIGFILFAVIFNLLFFYISREKMYLAYAITLLFSVLYSFSDILSKSLFLEGTQGVIIFQVGALLALMVMMAQTLRLFFKFRLYYPRWDKFLLYTPLALIAIGLLGLIGGTVGEIMIAIVAIIAIIYLLSFVIGTFIILILFLRKKDKDARLFVLAAFPFFLSLFGEVFTRWEWTVYCGGTWTILVLSWGLFARFKGLQIENARVALEKEEERSKLIAQQNELLEEQVAERTAELRQSITELKQAQDQLIQAEKMASLGELTAGIAHEIQNPLNFVNNFSDVSIELLEEMQEELDKGDTEEVKAIAGDIKQNLEKIAHHGRRADGIVKGMLQHSRASTGQKELTDINALADEYFRLAYHGLRAKDKSFNANLVTHFAEGMPKVNAMSQDVGRVLLNLFTNAFYATQQRSRQTDGSYKPTVEVSTQLKGDWVEIIVKDNGTGIPDAIKDKILQPFFTTKPTGEGTGLGLSLSYDIIVKAHGGTIDIESAEGQGATFIIRLPLKA
jgi:two-component system, NtrC family, sensor kinase